MNIKKILFATFLGALLSANASAQSLSYDVSLLTTSIEDGTAFGGATINTLFTGSFTVDSMELGEAVDDFGDTTIIDPIKLAYSFTIGDHDYSYAYDATRDYIADPDFGLGLTTLVVGGDGSGSNFVVEEVISFIFEQSGDADAYELDINTGLGTWVAYDDSTGYSISGAASMNVAAVPAPTEIWLLGAALIAFTGFKRQRLTT